MTEQSKSAVQLAIACGLEVGDYYGPDQEAVEVFAKAISAQAIELYKQELLKGVELPEALTFYDHPDIAGGVKWADCELRFIKEREDQLHQAIAAAVLPLKAEIEQKGIEIMIGLTKQQDLALSCKTLQSRVTQLEQELAEALAYKQDAENPNEWLSWDGGYEKQSYDVWVKGCDVVVGCWPNAGFMSAVDGTGRKWKPTDVLAVRVSEYQGRFPKPLHAARAQEVKTLDESKESEQ